MAAGVYEKIKKSHIVLFTLILSSLLIWGFYQLDSGKSLRSLCSLVFTVSACLGALQILGCILSIFISHKKKDTPQKPFAFLRGFAHIIPSQEKVAPIIFLTATIVYCFTNSWFTTAINYHHINKEVKCSVYGYSVLAEREGKEYTLPAAIVFADSSDVQLDTYEGSHIYYAYPEEADDGISVFHIYFKNGGYLFFENALNFNSLHDSDEGWDQNGNRWTVTLTNNYCKYGKIEEVNPLEDESPINLVINIFCSFLTSIVLFMESDRIVKHT